MTTTVQAVYENGVFRPCVPVDLPERTPSGDLGSGQCQANRDLAPAPMSEGLARIYAILGEALQLGPYRYGRSP